MVISRARRIICLATNIAVDAGKPTLLYVLRWSPCGLVPQGGGESYSSLVNSETLESIVHI
jgi:hypothetical protein